MFTTFEGDNTILMQLVAKGLLTDYKDSFEDLDQIGMVRFVASTAVETVLERTNARSILERLRDVVPVGRPGADEATRRRTCSTARYQLEMLTWREEHMLSSVARRLKSGMDTGRDPAEVFSLCQDHVISAAHAHVERIVLEAFLDKLATVEDGPNTRRPQAAVRPLRAVLHRDATVRGSSSTAGSPTPAPRRSPRRSTSSAGGSARSRSSSSTRSACPARCCAASCWSSPGS